tara:strand:- start:1184 stop:1312 length:129 start_codon:yes stop_codon:yes gene_type:complete
MPKQSSGQLNFNIKETMKLNKQKDNFEKRKKKLRENLKKRKK